MSPSNRRSRAVSIAGLLVLTLLWASSTLKPDLLPGVAPASLPYFARHALPLFLFAIAAGIFARSRHARLPGIPQIRIAALIGLGLFLFPATLVYLASPSLSGSARTALLCLVPIFTIVFAPHFGSPAQPSSRHALPAAMLALLGALLIFPIPLPPSRATVLAFAAIVLASASVGAANCLAETDAQTAPPAGATATLASVAAITGATSLALLSVFLEREGWNQSGSPFRATSRATSLATSLAACLPTLLWVALIELPALLLLFWLMTRISATRLSTRYLLAPILSILVGSALLRALSEIQPRTWLGLLLMAIGAACLIWTRENASPPTTLFPPPSED
jgi:drug/metabolite transporter (DMT)-like permease